MIKKKLYPKTQRLTNKTNYFVTEKLDGSNLSFFKLNDTLYIAQRNMIYTIDEIEELKQKMYLGLYEWLQKHAIDLKNTLKDGSAIIGEWIGMGQIKYGDSLGNNKFFMFAKANVNDKLEIYNLRYDHDLFIYPFKDQIIPDFISLVPIVAEGVADFTLADMDYLYDHVTHNLNRKVEGFILSNGTTVRKYVRYKNGELTDHKEGN